MRHTPGPWQDEITDDGYLIVRFPHAGNSTIDVCIGDMENTTGEDHANARLMAAAPDLLQAAIDARESLRRLPDTDGAWRVSCIKQLDDAIAKATNAPA